MPVKRTVTKESKVGRPSNLSKFGEIGRTGLKRQYGRISEEFLTKLQGQRGVKFYTEMSKNDPVCFAGLYAIERVLGQTAWELVPGGESSKDVEAVEFVRTCMNDMSHSFSDHVTETLSCLRYGWSYFEVVYKIRRGLTGDSMTNSDFDDGRIGWRKFAPRGQDTLDRWEFDKSGGVQGMYQTATFDLGESSRMNAFIPINKALLYRTQVSKSNPEGLSILRGAVKPYSYKKVIEELEGIGIERDLTGFPVVTPPEDFDVDLPENETTVQFMKDFVTHVMRGEQEGAMMPPKWTLELLGTPGKRVFDLNETINRYDKRIAMTLMTAWLMLGMDRTGSYAQSKNQTDIFFLSLVGWGELIADVFNRFGIKPLMRLNAEFSELRTFPKLQPQRIGLPNLDAIANYVFKLARVGGFIADEESQDFFRRNLFMQEAPSSREIGIKGQSTGKKRKPSPVAPPKVKVPGGPQDG